MRTISSRAGYVLKFTVKPKYFSTPLFDGVPQGPKYHRADGPREDHHGFWTEDIEEAKRMGKGQALRVLARVVRRQYIESVELIKAN